MGKEKHKRCPHCKSIKGFSVIYTIQGHYKEVRDFEGNVMDADRNEFNKEDDFGECLSCGKLINIENLLTDN